MPYLSASAVVIHYEEVLYQVYAPLLLPLPEVPHNLRNAIPPTARWPFGIFPERLSRDKYVLRIL